MSEVDLLLDEELSDSSSLHLSDSDSDIDIDEIMDPINDPENYDLSHFLAGNGSWTSEKREWNPFDFTGNYGVKISDSTAIPQLLWLIRAIKTPH